MDWQAPLSLSPSLFTCSCFFCEIFSLSRRITRKKTRFTMKQMASMRMDETQLRQRLKSSLIENLYRGRSSYLAGKPCRGGEQETQPTRVVVVSCIWGGLTAGRSPLAVSSRQHVSTKDTWPATRPTRSRKLVYFWS